MTTTAIDPAAALLQLSPWERPDRGAEEPGSGSAAWPPDQHPRRPPVARFWRFLVEPRPGIRHEDFFAPFGRPCADRPRPWC